MDFAFCVFTWGYGVRSLFWVYGVDVFFYVTLFYGVGMMRVEGATLVASLSHHREKFCIIKYACKQKTHTGCVYVDASTDILLATQS